MQTYPTFTQAYTQEGKIVYIPVNIDQEKLVSGYTTPSVQSEHSVVVPPQEQKHVHGMHVGKSIFERFFVVKDGLISISLKSTAIVVSFVLTVAMLY